MPMKAMIIIPPRDFRDETVSLAMLLLGKWGVRPVIASYLGEGKSCIGAHGATYKPEINATKATSEGFDALLIVDGPGVESYKLSDFRPLVELVKDFINHKKVVAALGDSVKVVARANVITDRKVAAPSDDEVSRMIRIYRGKESKNEMEFDKFLLTAKGNGHLEQFLDALIEGMGAK
ncbi:MAG: DJ-1/PfpI family protein [Candidatus Micrarchaeota archaeon]|nr:DJ-1/PfpI family protein [Candidatus Micrarchaeota archaeon]MDE1848076.1 DJ-1/PfpI family protein [Candidatus Micrarchaeota archaeon]MDE1864869.1 DJ-1/PfpI family protein [Candidatus Micrarchaeota archaeon]